MMEGLHPLLEHIEGTLRRRGYANAAHGFAKAVENIRRTQRIGMLTTKKAVLDWEEDVLIRLCESVGIVMSVEPFRMVDVGRIAKLDTKLAEIRSILRRVINELTILRQQETSRELGSHVGGSDVIDVVDRDLDEVMSSSTGWSGVATSSEPSGRFGDKIVVDSDPE